MTSTSLVFSKPHDFLKPVRSRAFSVLKWFTCLQFLTGIGITIYYVVLYAQYNAPWYNTAALGLNGAFLVSGLGCTIANSRHGLFIYGICQVLYHLVYLFRILLVLVASWLGGIYLVVNVLVVLSSFVVSFFIRRAHGDAPDPTIYYMERTASRLKSFSSARVSLSCNEPEDGPGSGLGSARESHATPATPGTCIDSLRHSSRIQSLSHTIPL